MDNTRFDEWFEKLGIAWRERDPEKAANLFSRDVEYYESVLNSPCENWERVGELWKAVPNNQKDVVFDFTVISTTDNLAVANWKVTRAVIPTNQKQLIDGIFVIKLNNEGLCNYFKQWRTVKEV